MPAVGKAYYDDMNKNDKPGKGGGLSFFRKTTNDPATAAAEPSAVPVQRLPPAAAVRRSGKRRRADGKTAMIDTSKFPALIDDEMSIDELIGKILDLVQKSEMSANSSQMSATAAQLAANVAQANGNKAESAGLKAETAVSKMEQLISRFESLSLRIDESSRRAEAAAGAAEVSAGTAQMAASTAQMAAGTAQLSFSEGLTSDPAMALQLVDTAIPILAPEPEAVASVDEAELHIEAVSAEHLEETEKKEELVGYEFLNVIGTETNTPAETETGARAEMETPEITAHTAVTDPAAAGEMKFTAVFGDLEATGMHREDVALGLVTMCAESSLPRVAPFIYDSPGEVEDTLKFGTGKRHDKESEGASSSRSVGAPPDANASRAENAPLIYDAMAELRRKVNTRR